MKFWKYYDYQIEMNTDDRMDADCDVLLYNLARRLCPNGYIFYCE
jgi:hypothetical protein